MNSESNIDESRNKDFLLNDFIFPTEGNEDNYGLYESPNFTIYYNIQDGNYYIKDFNTGVGALMKIKKYAMEGNTLINIGANYLVIYIEKNRILIKIFNNSILENTSQKEASNINCDIKQIDIEENIDSNIQGTDINTNSQFITTGPTIITNKIGNVQYTTNSGQPIIGESNYLKPIVF